MRAGAVIILLALAIAVGTAIAVVTGSVRIPERWNPWAPLRVDEPHGLLTRFKLMRISADPALCRAVLAGTGLRYAPVEDRRTGEGCGFDNAVKITQTSAQLATPITLSCRAAVSLALWERHVLQPAAQRRFGQRVARIEHFGSYACLNVGNLARSPFTYFHNISFMSCSLARSSRDKSNFSLMRIKYEVALGLVAEFTSFKSTSAATTLNPVPVTVSEKHRHMGSAPASYWSTISKSAR